MTENITERSETEFASVKGPLKMQRTASNEANLVSEIPNIVNNENFIIASGQEKSNFSFKRLIFLKRKHFRIFFLRVNLVVMLLEMFQ